MTNLRRKWTIKLPHQKIVLIKQSGEREEHVYMKAFLAHLYYPAYSNLGVEIRFPQEKRYKPDLLATNLSGEALFWGECGQLAPRKIDTICRRYRSTHFAFAKWDTRLDVFEDLVRKTVNPISRTAPIDLINFPDPCREALLDDGRIDLSFEDVQRIRI